MVVLNDSSPKEQLIKMLLGGVVHLGLGIGMVRLLKIHPILILLGHLQRMLQQVFSVIQSIDKTLLVQSPN